MDTAGENQLARLVDDDGSAVKREVGGVVLGGVEHLLVCKGWWQQQEREGKNQHQTTVKCMF